MKSLPEEQNDIIKQGNEMIRKGEKVVSLNINAKGLRQRRKVVEQKSSSKIAVDDYMN